MGYLGPPGTFSHQAAYNWSQQQKDTLELVPFKSIPEVLLAVRGGDVDAGVVPVENSIEGAVNLTLDRLRELKELSIKGEIIVLVEHCLAGKNSSLENIEVVYSHPQALAQCQGFLNKRLSHARIIETVSTAEAAGRVASQGEKENSAAISSPLAARRYGLQILAASIQDYEGNKTRFIIVGRGSTMRTGCDKTSLVVSPPENRPGVLYNILKEFARAEINLTRIESRPTKYNLGEYVFFLDCEGHCSEKALLEVISRVRTMAEVQILGSYPQHIEVESKCPLNFKK